MMGYWVFGGVFFCRQEAGESRSPGMETRDVLRRRIEVIAAEFLEEFGEIPADAEGCLLLPVEEWAVAVGDQLSQALMHEHLARASAPVEAPRCPVCGGPASHQKERKRRIQTRRGTIAASEPECYCNRCRRSFFPSLARAGDGA
jgi:hypothetical protein